MRSAEHVVGQMCSQGAAEENKGDGKKRGREDEGEKDGKDGLLDKHFESASWIYICNVLFQFGKKKK
jgi:hypothetical protein